MGLFDTMFGTTLPDPSGAGWDATVTTAGQGTMGKAFGAGLQGAIKGFQSPFGASQSSSSTSAGLGPPGAQSPQINYDAVMASLNRLPTSPAAVGKGKSSGVIWGPFAPSREGSPT